MIAIIDYGMGNLQSVHNAFKSLSVESKISSLADDIYNADGVILPGVGAFPICMENLRKLGLIEPIKEVVLKKPFLGICLGLQLLFEESEEYGPVKGLGIFPGKVKRFPEKLSYGDEKLKIPHMGWSEVRKIKETPFLDGIADNSFFYFVHSYYVETEESLISTKTFYGIDFVSSISYGNLFACQFHPEKSQSLGLKVLENFSNLINYVGKK